MQATIYRFDDIAWRNRARWSHPANPSDRDQFVCQLERFLQRLRDLHLRISLARLPLEEKADEARRRGQSLVDNLADPCALAGLMPDGSVVAAFLGPRDDDSMVGDDDMTTRIIGRFDRALPLTAPGVPLTTASLTIAHCWSDEIYDVSSLVLDLARARQASCVVNGAERLVGSHPA